MTWWSGTNASSTTTLCEPEPFRPMRSPQLSSRRNSGVTNAIVPPSSWMSPMWWVEYGIPEAKCHVPEMTRPPSTRRTVTSCGPKLSGAMNSPPTAPKISSCARSSK